MYSSSKIVNTVAILNFLEQQEIIIGSWNLQPEKEHPRMVTDSRQVEAGDVFICISGFEQDGHEYAGKALEAGAALLITERKLELEAAQIQVKNSRKAAALLAKLFYDDPSAKFTLIGITGTNGKTTITSLLEQMIRQQDKKVGIIGTLGYRINGSSYTSNLTTPDIVELNSIFQHMVEQEVEYVVMEVSSHSLYLERVYGLDFDLAVFTNLTREHLDFHKNMDDYFQAKARLFDLLNSETGTAHINIDDNYGLKLFEKIGHKKFSISLNAGDLKITNIVTGTSSSSFELSGRSRDLQLRSNFIAEHNIQNITLALSVFLDLFPAVEDAEIVDLVQSLLPVDGRLEAITNDLGISIYVDYAHTPDALENVLSSLQNLKKGRLITVFGAGGKRDKEKRPLMLKSALKNSDLTIITNDNPRTEPAEQIISDIVGKTDPAADFYIIRDRRKAIAAALKIAVENDIILIAGKGHETFQYVGDVKIPFDDKLVVKEITDSYSPETEQGKLALPLDLPQVAVLFTDQPENLEEIYFENISIDSRTIRPNSLFVALEGENFDGHDFVDEVLQVDNCWAIVNKDHPAEDPRLIKVEDTLTALGELARKYGNLFPALKIAITGSVGKTTTKEYLYNILSLKASTLRTHSNENNLIGLPKTLFKLRPEHKYAILELGSNKFGEIARLSDICNPDMAIITSIGASHLEFFQDEAGVFEEKKALFDRKLKLRFFPGEDFRFKQYFGITFGTTEACDYRISNIVKTENSTEFLVNDEKYSIPTLYDTFTQNALIAISLCRELAISYEHIQKGLNRPLSVPNRMEIIQNGERTILADCYNANPQSMKAAIKFWKEYQPDKHHTAILGDMLELGELAVKLHENIAEHLKGIPNALIVSVGDLAAGYGAEQHFDNVDLLINSNLLAEIPQDSVILLKASHGIELEKFIERIRS